MDPVSGIGISALDSASVSSSRCFLSLSRFFDFPRSGGASGLIPGALRGTLTVRGIPGANSASIVTEFGRLEGPKSECAALVKRCASIEIY